MYRKSKNQIIIISTILFTILFHRQNIGLNLLIFESFIITWFYFTKQFRLIGKNQITITVGLVITMLSTVFTFSMFAYIINFLMLFLFIGLIIYSNAKSVINIFKLSLSNIINSQIQFIKNLKESKFRNYKIVIFIWKSKIFIIPLFIIILFLLLYSNSNPVFNDLIQEIGSFFNRYFSFIIEKIDTSIIITLLFGLIISVFIFIRIANNKIIERDKISSENLYRIKNRVNKKNKPNSLKNEYKAALFLLLILNIILFVVNVIDISWVWFNFEWNGLSLKQFVHEGTYLLILSIIISVIVVLYYFRNNLNFYSKNRFIKYFSYAWLAQNAILAISVAIRNFWYIYYYSLAYKRIGVLIFLILTLYGLFTVFIKVKNRKTNFYLLKTNSYFLVVILVLFSIINWDNVIAKYNFKNYKNSFIHFDYLSSLSDKSLPYLNKSLSELKEIELIQREKFFTEQQNYMSSEKYYQTIEARKIEFKQKWESKGILSWNFPEYIASRKLFYSDNTIHEN